MWRDGQRRVGGMDALRSSVEVHGQGADLALEPCPVPTEEDVCDLRYSVMDAWMMNMDPIAPPALLNTLRGGRDGQECSRGQVQFLVTKRG